MYSLQTSLIILGMVVAGTARSVGVKIFYQLGYDNPLFVALLYLVGQSMALIVYFIDKYWRKHNGEAEPEYVPISNKALEVDGHSAGESTADSSDELCELELQAMPPLPTPPEPESTPHLDRCQSAPIVDATPEQEPHSLKHAHSLPVAPTPTIRRRGSKTGLTQESHDAVAWVHAIPWQVKPLIPGLINLANAALKWASFIYVPASIAEMVMSGLELVLSVVAQRVIRKRQVSSTRWTGVAVVFIGLITVNAADVWDARHTGGQSFSDQSIGFLLIFGQCVTAVAEDIAEELFLHEAEFPATQLLGLEGIVGLIFGIPLYLRYSSESPLETLADLKESPAEMMYVIILTLVFTITGIFNIMATEATSSMTRNMWKNCRTLMVWLTGLIIFYTMGDVNLGEEWIVPDSFLILGGFFIMLSGIYVYYKNK